VATRVIPAVHFDDEPRARGEEIGDETADTDLAAEPHPELATTELVPQQALRRSEPSPVLPGTMFQERIAGMRASAAQEDLLGPEGAAGLRPHWRKIRDAGVSARALCDDSMIE
jgi:hypothetical protein